MDSWVVPPNGSDTVRLNPSSFVSPLFTEGARKWGSAISLADSFTVSPLVCSQKKVRLSLSGSTPVPISATYVLHPR